METDRWDGLYNRVHVYRENHPACEQRISYNPAFPQATELSRRIGGHGGSDFYTMHYFLQKILGRPEGKHAIDVYQGLDMTLPRLLGYRSIVEGNIPIDIPDFRNKQIREKYRTDRWCCDPKLARKGQLKYGWSGGEVKVPDSVYRKQQKECLR